MERTERFIRITDPGPEPLRLYAPAAYVALRVQKGQVYSLTMSDSELQTLTDAGLAEEAAPGTFTTFHQLVHVDSRYGNDDYSWLEVPV